MTASAAKQSRLDRAREALRVVEKRLKNTEQRRRNRVLEKIRIQNSQSAAVCNDNAEFLDAICTDKAAVLHAGQLAYALSEETSGKGLEYQRAVLEKLLEHPVLEHALPEFIANRKYLESCAVVCKSVSSAWSELKWGVGKDHSLARSVIEAAVSAVDNESGIFAAARCIGMNRRTLRRGAKRRQSLNLRADGEVWARTYRRKRKDTLSQDVIDSVVQWWTEETRVSPCKKDVRRKRIGVKKFINHATHWLEESQLDFYTRFNIDQPLKCSFVCFRRLKPFFVKRLTDFNSCCCRYHQEMAEITAAFNTMRSNAVHLGTGEMSCLCGCATLCCRPINGVGAPGVVMCQSAMYTFKRSTHLWEQTLCLRPEGLEWHNLKCIMGNCPSCGFHLLSFCNRELDPLNTNLMLWRRFEMVSAGMTKKGDPKTVIRLEYKLTTPRQFLAFAKPKIAAFVKHQFVASWQDMQYKACIANLKEGEVMSLIDFAENYSFKGQNEIQSQHWYNFQLTILVHITYTVNPNWDPLDNKSKRLITDYFYYISDDRKHDSLFVQYCLSLHWRHLVDSGSIPTRHVIWSDGCAGQFKGAKTWFYVSKYPSMTRTADHPLGCSLDWHFWGTGHGKGPHDGAGACIKQTLRKEQLKPDSIQLHNAKDVVDFLQVAMNLPNGAYPGARRVVRRHFLLIGDNEVPREHPLACKTVPGSRSMHSICSVGPSNNVLLQCRDFSCFCLTCLARTNGICSNNSHVSPFKLITLEPLSSEEAIQEMEESEPDWEQEPASNDLAMDLEVGDHFAVLADPNDLGALGAEFFILLCTKPLHVVQEVTASDSWGKTVDQGDEVVEGLYYRQQGRLPNSYVLLQNEGIAILHSHLVCASKFTMNLASHKQKGGTSVYRLSPQSLIHINEVVKTSQQRADLDSDNEDIESLESEGGSDDEDLDNLYDSEFSE